ncbi:hypothetical protein [Shinella sp. G-2]|uniref:hypothetical protein n=1 Tax=Shinella sp. G-2 TaxID=3133141 RepID=UPI003D02AE4C
MSTVAKTGAPTGERGRIRKADRAIVWTQETMAQAARLWAGGETSTHIARQFGISRGSFSGMAARNRHLFPPKTASAIPLPKAGPWTAEAIATCIRLRRGGMTMKAIAEVIGVKKATVENLARKRRDLFEAPAVPVVAEAAAPAPARKRSFVGDRWVERVPYVTISGAVVSLPRISLLEKPISNGKET